MRRHVLLAALGALASGPTLFAKPEGVALANSFAEAYREWGALYQSRNPNELNLKEIRAWHTLKERFSALRKYIDLEYSE